MLCNMYLSRVNVPMGGTQEAHTSLEVRRGFSYANVRKASYRGIKTFLMYILTIIMIYCISVQVLCDWRNIPNLVRRLSPLHNDDQN